MTNARHDNDAHEEHLQMLMAWFVTAKVIVMNNSISHKSGGGHDVCKGDDNDIEIANLLT